MIHALVLGVGLVGGGVDVFVVSADAGDVRVGGVDGVDVCRVCVGSVGGGGVVGGIALVSLCARARGSAGGQPLHGAGPGKFQVATGRRERHVRLLPERHLSRPRP